MLTRSLTVLFPAVLAGLLALAPAAQCQPKPKPKPRVPARAKPLVVEQLTNSPWRVTVAVDKSDRTYANGDLVAITVRSDQDGYLYLFNIDNAGSVTVLFPNQFQSNNAIVANQDVVIPSPSDRTFQIRAVTTNGGTELVKALVTKDQVKELSEVEKLARSVRKAKQWRPPQMTLGKFKRLAVEVIGGNPGSAGPDPGVSNQNQEQGQVTPPPAPPTQDQLQVSVDKEKTKIQQDNPAQYQEKMNRWATGQVEITILPGKGKDKPNQETPGQSSEKKPK